MFKKKRAVAYGSKTPGQHATFFAAGSNFYFTNVTQADNAQDCADLFHQTSQSLFDQYYPIRTITLLYLDPPFMTSELKCLLIQKNHLMRAGNIEKAEALAVKIGKFIAAYNSTRLFHIHHSSNTKDL